MRYRVTFSSGAQHEVDSDLSFAEFAKGLPLTADIQTVPNATPVGEQEPVVEETPKRKARAKAAE